jgi:hypothetical protein
MDGQDVNEIIRLMAASSSTLRGNVRQSCLQPNDGGRLRFEAPTGSLDDAAYDLFRATPYLLSCASCHGDVEVGFVTRKQAIQSPPGICYHATPATNEAGIRSRGLVIGRVSGVSSSGSALYTDARQYIHASLTEEQALIWYYDRFGHTQPGVVLAIDLAAAGARLIKDPRSTDGIIDAVQILPDRIAPTPKKLPGVSEMQTYLRGQSWTWTEVPATVSIEASLGKMTRLFRGKQKMPGAWLDFYRAVRPGAL